MIAGGFFLVKGADLFVDGAARLARAMHIPPTVIGLTVVAFGTSVPDLFVNIAAAVSGDAGIALGNAIGGTIVAGLPGLGICACTRPLTIARHGMVDKAIAFYLLAAIVLWGMAADMAIDGAFYAALSRSEGLVLIAFFIVFLITMAAVAPPVSGLPRIVPVLPGKSGRLLLTMAMGFCGLLLGGRMLVDGASALAVAVGISQRVIGLTIVAAGTSVADLATSIAAVRRGEVEIAVGNLVGGNVFTMVFVLGLSALIHPLPLGPASHVDMGVVTAAAVLLFVFMGTGSVRVMGRREGVLAMLIYLVYLGYLVSSVLLPGGRAG